MNLFAHIKKVLEQEENYCKDGKLFKNVVVEAALKLDPALLKLLLKDKDAKKHFFVEIEGVAVFDKIKFQKFVSNKKFLPDSFTAYSNKIGLTANGEYLTEANEVVLDFPYKDCVLEGGQTKEEQKRQEVFWNETLAPDEIDRLFEPKVFTNWKRFDNKGEHAVKSISKTDNLIIKGNNLLALHSLLDRYKGEVKLIYIDPPYNTGSDGFDYNDSFNHSTWLTFIRNRLVVAKKMLCKEGTIAISIDHNELPYLLLLADEIFGKENLKNIITVKRGSVTGAKVINPGVVNISDYVVLYSRQSNKWSPNRVYMTKDWDRRYNGFILNYEAGTEKWEFTTLLQAFADFIGCQKSKLKKQLGEDYEFKLEEFFYKNSEKIIQLATLDDNSISNEAIDLKLKSQKNPSKVFIMDREGKSSYYVYNGKLILFAKDRMNYIDGKETFSQPATDIWDDVLPNDLHNEGGVALRKGKKPEKLIARLIELCTNDNDLVLDFFVGSGTTGAVALKLNRQFIVCEQLDYTDTLPVNRMVNTINGEQSGISKSVNWKGGGSFVYAELAKDNATYIDTIEKAKNTKALLKIWDALKGEAFISYKVKPEDIDSSISDFKALSLDNQKKLLVSLLDKNQLYVNYCDIDDKTHKISKEDKTLNQKFYNL